MASAKRPVGAQTGKPAAQSAKPVGAQTARPVAQTARPVGAQTARPAPLGTIATRFVAQIHQSPTLAQASQAAGERSEALRALALRMDQLKAGARSAIDGLRRDSEAKAAQLQSLLDQEAKRIADEAQKVKEAAEAEAKKVKEEAERKARELADQGKGAVNTIAGKFRR